MKITTILLCIFLSGNLFSQLGIGISETTSPSISLEFGTENRGLILPWVMSETEVINPVDGTLIFDADDNKVKVKLATGWTDLSIDETGTTLNPISNLNGIDIQLGLVDASEASVSVGVESSTPGILVLEDFDQAMVLPKVASPHLNILNPSPGLIVYDTVAKQLAVFNGSVWSFWKP